MGLPKDHSSADWRWSGKDKAENRVKKQKKKDIKEKNHRLQKQIRRIVEFENAHLRKNRRKHLRRNAPRTSWLTPQENNIKKKKSSRLFCIYC